VSVGVRRWVRERLVSWCQGPISSASQTTIQPVPVFHVVSVIMVPGR
jgi:hypothetical protein